MKTAKRQPRWRLKPISDNEYYAELDNGSHRTSVTAFHCKACAIVGLILKHGGDADLRGMSSYGACYQMLAVTVRASRDPLGEDAS